MILLSVMVLSVCLGSGCVTPPIQKNMAPTIQKGDSPPDLVGQTLDGQEIHLSDYSGNVVVIIFWKSWCMACTKELLDMKLLLRAYQKKFILFAVNIGEPYTVVRTFRVHFILDFPVLLDTHSVISSAYGVRAWPTTILVDREGKVRFITVGAEMESLRQEIDALL